MTKDEMLKAIPGYLITEEVTKHLMLARFLLIITIVITVVISTIFIKRIMKNIETDTHNLFLLKFFSLLLLLLIIASINNSIISKLTKPITKTTKVTTDVMHKDDLIKSWDKKYVQSYIKTLPQTQVANLTYVKTVKEGVNKVGKYNTKTNSTDIYITSQIAFDSSDKPYLTYIKVTEDLSAYTHKGDITNVILHLPSIEYTKGDFK